MRKYRGEKIGKREGKEMERGRQEIHGKREWQGKERRKTRKSKRRRKEIGETSFDTQYVC